MRTRASRTTALTVAQNVRLLRDSRAWSRAELARAAGVTERAVLEAEQGSVADAEALSAALGVPDIAAPLEGTPSRVLVTLRRVPRASALAPLLLVDALVIARFDLAGPAHERARRALERRIEHAIDAWPASGPVERLRFTDGLQRALDELHRAGLALTAGALTPRPDAKKPASPISMFVTAPADAPRERALWTPEMTRSLFE